MPVHIEQFNSELSFSDAEMPLSEEQMNAIVERVKQSLQMDDREAKAITEATELRTKATPPTVVEE